jgi:hypothetical protein
VNFSGEAFCIDDDEEALVSSSPLTDDRIIGVNNGAWLRRSSTFSRLWSSFLRIEICGANERLRVVEGARAGLPAHAD